MFERPSRSQAGAAFFSLAKGRLHRPARTFSSLDGETPAGLALHLAFTQLRRDPTLEFSERPAGGLDHAQSPSGILPEIPSRTRDRRGLCTPQDRGHVDRSEPRALPGSPARLRPAQTNLRSAGTTHRAFCGLEQPGRCGLERLGDLPEDPERWVTGPTFDTADIGPIEIRREAKLLLRDPKPRALLSNRQPEGPCEGGALD